MFSLWFCRVFAFRSYRQTKPLLSGSRTVQELILCRISVIEELFTWWMAANDKLFIWYEPWTTLWPIHQISTNFITKIRLDSRFNCFWFQWKIEWNWHAFAFVSPPMGDDKRSSYRQTTKMMHESEVYSYEVLFTEFFFRFIHIILSKIIINDYILFILYVLYIVLC